MSVALYATSNRRKSNSFNNDYELTRGPPLMPRPGPRPHFRNFSGAWSRDAFEHILVRI